MGRGTAKTYVLDRPQGHFVLGDYEIPDPAPGTVLIAIPYDKLGPVTDGLKKIEWYPAMYREGPAAHDKKFGETVAALHKRLETD